MSATPISAASAPADCAPADSTLVAALPAPVAARLDAQAVATLGLLAALAVLGATGVLPLLGWTARMFPRTRYPWLFAALAAGYLGLRLARTPAGRRLSWLTSGAAAGALVDPGFTALTMLWSLAYAQVLRATVAARWKHLYLAATFAALVLAVNRDLYPGVAAHPFIERWSYLFALGLGLRALWLHHELTVAGFPRVPAADVVAAFVCAPLFVILPYMLAIPRFSQLREALRARRPALEADGLRMVAFGIIWALAAEVVRQAVAPRPLFEGLLRAHRLGEAALLALPFYPMWQVLDILGAALILVGLLRLYGVDIAPAFDRPLLAESLTEWWRRWNTHFRDLLVDLCYYPVVLRLRRRPVLGIVAGCGAVFVLGSTLLHWLFKAYFVAGTARQLPLGILAENLSMGLFVAIALVLERRRVRAPSTHWLARWRRRLTTWALVWLSVVGINYAVEWRLVALPRERALARAAEVHALVAAGRCAEAARAARAARPSITHAHRLAPRHPALGVAFTQVTSISKGAAPCP